jgi:hypothetical protein
MTVALLLSSGLAAYAQARREKTGSSTSQGRSRDSGEKRQGREAVRQAPAASPRSAEPARQERAKPQPPVQRQAQPSEGRRFGGGAQEHSRQPATTAPNSSPTFGRPRPDTQQPRMQPGQQPGYAPSRVPGRQPESRGRQPGGQNPGSRSAWPAASRPGGNPGGNRGTEIIRTRSGGEIRRGPGGAIREVRTPGGAVIHHAPTGVRRVEVVRPGGTVVVARSHNYGYVQRPLVVHNVTYVQRTYVYRGVPHARVYRPWVWGGATFHIYTPIRYYRPAFYSWIWNPWPRPVYYSWGWAGRPWYGYYGGWFTPYPYYASPAFWLTDYLIATTLENAYEERAAAAAARAYAYDSGQVALTPEVKNAIADEVHRQMEAERAQEASGGQGGSIFDGGSHVFVVSDPLQVDDGGAGCVLTEGDVLQMTGAPPAEARSVTVTVLASKGQDCGKGSRVQLGLNDLIEMQNQMRATVDQGLNELQSRQGQGGLPALPPGTAGATNASFASEVRPDSNAASELNQAAQDADRAEQDVMSQAADASQTVRVALGMTVAEIEQAMGKPREVADVGSKKIYVYRDMKITFVGGRVSDVQ